MTKEEIIKKLRDMAKYPTVTLPRDTEALRNAADLLEQAQKQEPVAYRCWNNPQNADGTFDILRIWVSTKPEGYGNEPLTSQHRVDETAKQRHEQEPVIDKSAAIRIATALGWTPPRQPLTDEEINKKWSEALADTEGQTYLPLTEFARAIEAKLKEKNT